MLKLLPSFIPLPSFPDTVEEEEEVEEREEDRIPKRMYQTREHNRPVAHGVPTSLALYFPFSVHKVQVQHSPQILSKLKIRPGRRLEAFRSRSRELFFWLYPPLKLRTTCRDEGG